MKIYRAETGKRIRVRKSFESLDELKAELEQLGDVPISSQILITSFGIPLKNNMLNEANKAIGKDEFVIFLFDRELLDANNSNNIKVLIEEPLLEPPINVSTSIVPIKLQKRSNLNNINLTEECGAYVNLFQTYHSHGKSIIKAAKAHVEFCERLYQEQKIQLMALRVALTNLDSHCRSVIDAHEDFNVFSEKEITKQSKVIKSLSTDMEMLRRITIHPNLLKDAKNVDVINEKESYTLGDFVTVTEDKLIILAKEGKQTYDQLSRSIQELTARVRSVQSGTGTLREKNFDSLFPKMEESISKIQSYNNKLIQIAEKLERDVTRVQNQVSKILESNTRILSTTTTKSIEALEHLSDIQSQDYLPEMQKYDLYIREQVKFLVICKNTMTTTLITNLQEISRLESSIAGIPGSLSRLDAEVRSKAQDYKSLIYVHQMPTAYAKTIVEIVRRKEYTKLILTKAQQIAEIMGHFRNIEQKRRESYRMDVKKYVPFNIPALDDNPPPMCDISTANLKEDKLPSFTTEDIHSFSNFIGEIRPAIMSQASFYRSPIFTSSLSKTRPSQDDPLAAIQEILLKLARQIEGMNYEFDHIVGKNFLSEKNDNDRNGNSVSNPTSILGGRAQLAPPLGRRSKRLSRQSYSEDSSPQIDVNMDLIFEKTRQLDKAEEKIKAYEARIKNLENILHTNYKAVKNSTSQSKLDIASSKVSMTSTLIPDEELAELRSRYNNLQSSYNVEVNEKKKIVNELESSYKNLEVSYKAAINEKETLLKRISELELRHQDSESSRAEAVKEIEERASNFETRYQDMESSYMDVVNIKSSLEKKIEELKKNLEAVENSYALIVKEKETLSNEHSYLQNKFNELEISYETSKERCNELETKVTELETKIIELDRVTPDNKKNDFLSGLEQKCQELESENDEYEKKLDNMRYELEKQTGILEAAKSNLKSTLTEKSELETRLDEYKQEFTGKENSYKQDQLELKKKIEELETRQFNQEQIEAVEELWKKKFEELQKEKDEQIKKLQKEKDDKIQEFQELQKENKEIIQELQKDNEKIQELQKKNDKKIQELQKENDEKVQELQKENDEKIQELQEKVQELQKENEEKIQELQMENDEKVQELQMENEEKVQELQKENEEKLQELQMENEEKIRRLQKESDEKIQEYESNKNNLQHDIEGWKASFEKMHFAHDKCQKDFDKTRDRARLAEQEIAEKQAALEQVEKLVKNITEVTVEYMPVADSYDPFNSNEQKKLESSLNPINMIKKLGGAAMSMSRELQDSRQLIEESKVDNEDLESSLKGINQMLKERTEFSRLLSKYLWEYYNNLRTLMSAMGLSIPLKSEKPIVITSTEEEKRLSDSYYAQDLGKFFSSDISNEPSEWPKDKYETLLTLSTKVDLNEVREMIRKTPKDAENLIKKYQSESKLNKDKYRKANQESKDKIAVRNFKNGDLALFLPTRNNSTTKPWAAFNINFPHCFLRTTEVAVNQIRNRDWVVARIVNITECIVDMKNPNTNPYDLTDGVKYYLLDVDGFMNNNSTTSNYSRKRADSESSFNKPSRFGMSASISNLAPIKDDEMSSSTADIRRSMPASRTYSTTPSFSSSFKSIFFSSNGSETKENNQSSSDL